jgi:cytochrome b561
VLFLVILRLAIRFYNGPKPPILPRPPQWQEWLARGFHIALYALMFGMPLAGWLILSFGGKPIPFFGFELPALVAENKDLSKWVKDIHETAAVVGYYLIGFHASASLVHHYFFRDNTLRRMFFGKNPG